MDADGTPPPPPSPPPPLEPQPEQQPEQQPAPFVDLEPQPEQLESRAASLTQHSNSRLQIAVRQLRMEATVTGHFNYEFLMRQEKKECMRAIIKIMLTILLTGLTWERVGEKERGEIILLVAIFLVDIFTNAIEIFDLIYAQSMLKSTQPLEKLLREHFQEAVYRSGVISVLSGLLYLLQTLLTISIEERKYTESEGSGNKDIEQELEEFSEWTWRIFGARIGVMAISFMLIYSKEQVRRCQLDGKIDVQTETPGDVVFEDQVVYDKFRSIIETEPELTTMTESQLTQQLDIDLITLQTLFGKIDVACNEDDNLTVDIFLALICTMAVKFPEFPRHLNHSLHNVQLDLSEDELTALNASLIGSVDAILLMCSPLLKSAHLASALGGYTKKRRKTRRKTRKRTKRRKTRKTRKRKKRKTNKRRKTRRKTRKSRRRSTRR